MKNISDKICK